jgi:hypothetical protein
VTDQPRAGHAEDYGYDLAHEATPGAAPPHPEHEHPPSVYVGTETDDRDGDYGYDLAHDVPPPRPRDPGRRG